MSRSGYFDDEYDPQLTNCWRGAVDSAINGQRGQAFLKEMQQAMEQLPEKKLIAEDLEIKDGGVCAIGTVGRARGIDMTNIDPEDSDTVAKLFGIAPALAREIVYMNDEGNHRPETPEERFTRMQTWVRSNLTRARQHLDALFNRQEGNCAVCDAPAVNDGNGNVGPPATNLSAVRYRLHGKRVMAHRKCAQRRAKERDNGTAV